MEIFKARSEIANAIEDLHAAKDNMTAMAELKTFDQASMMEAISDIYHALAQLNRAEQYLFVAEETKQARDKGEKEALYELETAKAVVALLNMVSSGKGPKGCLAEVKTFFDALEGQGCEFVGYLKGLNCLYKELSDQYLESLKRKSRNAVRMRYGLQTPL